jgi:hypothetical protein
MKIKPVMEGTKYMKKGRKILGASMVTVIAVAIVATIFFNMQVAVPLVEDDITQKTVVKQRKWSDDPLADADPGAGNSGFMYIMCYPHQGDPGTAYASNLSNDSAAGGAYEFSDALGAATQMTNETPWGTTFDFVMKIRINNTDGYNVSQWEDDWTRANITVDFLWQADLNDIAMTEVVIGTEATTYRWYHYYANNGGSGYTLSKGETFDIDALTNDIFE